MLDILLRLTGWVTGNLSMVLYALSEKTKIKALSKALIWIGWKLYSLSCAALTSYWCSLPQEYKVLIDETFVKTKASYDEAMKM